MKKLEFTHLPPLDYACSEAINTLCTNLSFTGSEKKVILFTSYKAGEGKTFLIINTGHALAKLGYRVAIVDLDLRRSRMNGYYGIQGGAASCQGASHYLAGKCDWEDAFYETNLPSIFLMPVGQLVSNSLSLLNTSRLHEMLLHLRKHFDYVLVDTPPVGIVVDAAVIAKSCDGALFVVGYNDTSCSQLMESKLQLERSGCEILGAVLNKVDFDMLSARMHYEKSYYTQEYRSADQGKASALKTKRRRK